MQQKEEQINTVEHYYSSLVFWLRITGIDILNKSESFLYRLNSAFHFLYATAFTLVAWIEFKYHSDFNMIAIIIFYVFADSLTVLKAAVIYNSRKEFGNLMMSFQEGFFKLDNRREGEFREQCLATILEKNRYHKICYGICVMMSCISGLATSLKSRLTESPENWVLPYAPMSVVDISKSPTFEIMCAIHVVAAYVICTWMFLTDCTVISIIAQTTAQIKMLEYCVRNPKSVDLQKRLKSGGKLIDDALDYTLNYHLSILETVDKVEHLCNYMILCVFLSALITMCVILYNASAVPLASVEFAKYFSYFGMIGFQPFLYCWWANEMTLANESLAVGISQSYNPDAPITTSKAIKLMLVRAQKPLFFTAGKFVPLSLETFKGILKASFSYFTVLRQANSQ